MDQHAINIISVKVLAMKVDPLKHFGGFAVNLGLDEKLLPRESFDGVGDPPKGG